jgi:hypothetical protein
MYHWKFLALPALIAAFAERPMLSILPGFYQYRRGTGLPVWLL